MWDNIYNFVFSSSNPSSLFSNYSPLHSRNSLPSHSSSLNRHLLFNVIKSQLIAINSQVPSIVIVNYPPSVASLIPFIRTMITSFTQQRASHSSLKLLLVLCYYRTIHLFSALSCFVSLSVQVRCHCRPVPSILSCHTAHHPLDSSWFSWSGQSRSRCKITAVFISISALFDSQSLTRSVIHFVVKALRSFTAVARCPC